MVVEAKFDTINKPLNFIFDTGSSGISLDSATCGELQLKPTPTDTNFVGLGVSRKVGYLFNKSLHLPNLSVSNLNFHVSNYDILSMVYGEKIDGIIGYAFLNRYIVKINFDSLIIEVYAPGKYKYEKGGMVLTPQLNRRIPSQQVKLRDNRRTEPNLFFDTGAGLNALLNEKFVTDSGILSSKRKIYETQSEGVGGKLQMGLTVVKWLQLGKYRFNNVPVQIYDDLYNVTSYPFASGLLGNDLLRRFNLTLNYPAGEVHIIPNSHYQDVFDYAYTGLGIYFQNGQIYVEDVLTGSPGEKAGIKEGDIIIGVGLNFSNNISQYKELLQSAKDKIRLVIKRNGELKEIVIKPESIL